MLHTPFPLQVIGVCLSVVLLYVIGSSRHSSGVVTRQLIVLGKYSLFAYVAQIAALQLLRLGFPVDELSGIGTLLPLVLAVLATVGSVQAMAAFRARSAVVDRLYRTVFA